jgi:hypothetical protein
MTVLPGDVECLAILLETKGTTTFTGDGSEASAGVNLTNPLDGCQFETGLPRIDEELKRPGADHGVIGNATGGREIFLEGRILHELDITKTCKALSSNRIGRGINPKCSGVDGDASEVVDRVEVLSTRQSADGHLTRFTFVAAGVVGEAGLDPVDDLPTLALRWLRHPLGRHRLLFKHGHHPFPLLKMGSGGGLRHELLEVQTRLRCIRTVTGIAVLLEYRADTLPWIGIGGLGA